MSTLRLPAGLDPLSRPGPPGAAPVARAPSRGGSAGGSRYALPVGSLGGGDKRELLLRVPLFAEVGPGEADSLVEAMRSRQLRPREELFHKGDAGGQIYLVVEGRLKILTTSIDGDDVVFNIVGPGEVIGEIALLTGEARTATVRAIDRCSLLVLDRRDFLDFLKRHPEVSARLLGVLAERVRRLSELLEDTLFLNLPVRLAKKFVAFMASDGEETPKGVRINLKLSQEEWGDLVGVTRESINKQMRSWSEKGLIEVDHGYIVVRRPEEIEALSEIVLS